MRDTPSSEILRAFDRGIMVVPSLSFNNVCREVTEHNEPPVATTLDSKRTTRDHSTDFPALAYPNGA